MDSLSKEVNLILIVAAFLLLVAVGIVALVLVYRRKQVEYVHEQNRLKAAFEKELLEAQLQVQEQTLKHVAQEVHDNVNQTLGLAKLNLNTIRGELADGVGEKIGATKELVGKAIADLRSLSKSLHADAVMAGGIGKAIETELARIAKTGAFETGFSTDGDALHLDAQKELILFRTVQEALNNAIKHSGAARIAVALVYNASSLELTVADDGRGFDAGALRADPERGLGLRNMENRIGLLGGRLSVHSKNPGTEIQISLPIIAG